MEKRILLALLAVLTVAFARHSAGPSAPAEGAPSGPEAVPVDLEEIEDLSLEDLEELNGGEVRIIRHPKTGVPLEIEGVFSARPILTAEDAVSALLNVRGLMGVGGSEFSCEDVDDERNGIRAFTLRQLYEGIPVEQGVFQVYAGDDGTPIAVRGIWRETAGAAVRPSVTAEEGKKSLTLEGGSRAASPELVIYAPDGGGPSLSWRYWISSGDPLKEKYVFVSAGDGTVLGERPAALD